MRTLRLILGVFALVSCSGLSARQEALLPALRLAWPSVEADVRTGIEESVLALRLVPPAAEDQRASVSRLADALAAGNPAAVASVAWAPLAESAEFGITRRIARNEISTGVAGSLRERLRNFGEGLTVFLERR